MPRTPLSCSRDPLAVFNAAIRNLVRLGRIPADVIAHPSPYPVWLLDAADLDQAEPIQSAYQAGWRYFAFSTTSPQTFVAADIAGGRRPLLLNISYGPQVAAEYSRVQEAESLDGVAGTAFSVRTLRVPGALMQAVWFKPDDPGDAGQLLPFGKSFVAEGVERKRFPTNTYLHKVHPTSAIPRTKGIRFH